jgi:predicted nucleic acid-binding protein
MFAGAIMSGRDFLDTNVLLYSLNESFPGKRKTAQDLIQRAIAGEFSISIQVLAEFAAVTLKKFRDRVTPQEVVALLDTLNRIPSIKPDAEIVRRAVEAHATYNIGFYDGMIIAAAERAGSKKIYSEDLNAGQKYFGIEVVDPFRL